MKWMIILIFMALLSCDPTKPQPITRDISIFLSNGVDTMGRRKIPIDTKKLLQHRIDGKTIKDIRKTMQPYTLLNSIF